MSLFLCMVLESDLVSFFYKCWPVLPARLVKEIIFSSFIYSCLLCRRGVYRCMDLSLGFLFCSIDLYFCLCASTMLPWWRQKLFSSVQFISVAQSCPTLCDPMNCSTPGLPVHHQLPEFTQTQVRWVSDAIQPSHPLSSPSSLAPNPSQHQSLFQWVNSSHEVAKVLELQL